MIFTDEMKNMKIYRRSLFLPYNDKDKKHGSLVYLMTPNYPSSRNLMNHPLLINRRYFESYYMERNAMFYINPSASKKALDEYAVEIPVNEDAIHNGLNFDSFSYYLISKCTDEESLMNTVDSENDLVYYDSIASALVSDKVENGKYQVFTHDETDKYPVLLGSIEVLIIEYTDYKAKYNWLEFSDFEIEEVDYTSYAKLRDKDINEAVYNNLITNRWNIVSKDGANNACCQVAGYKYPMRERASLIVLDGTKVFCKIDNDGSVCMPGGGLEPGENPQHASEREAKEEARLLATDVKFEGNLIEYHDEVKKWVKENVDPQNWWYGYYTHIYIGRLSGEYDGKIDDRDVDEMIDKGKWYDIHDVLPKMPLEYQNAIKSYMQGESFQEASDESAMNEATNSYAKVIKRWAVYDHHHNDMYNPVCIVQGYDKPFRERACMIIVKNGKIFGMIEKNGKMGFAGGGIEEGETPEEAAIREAKEEARINVKNVKQYGNMIELIPTPHGWVQEFIDKKDWWYGEYSYIFIGEYASKYSGKVADIDKDPLIKYGKWYTLEEAIPYLYPEYRKAIELYLYGESFQEAHNIIPTKNLELNLDKWDKGTPLFITGSSGDGKSTLANKMGKKCNAIVVHTDFLLFRLSRSKESWDNKMQQGWKDSHNPDGGIDEISLEYISSHPNLPYLLGGINKVTGKINWASIEDQAPYFEDFLSYVVEVAKTKYKNRYIIVEGGGVLYLDPDMAAELPLIVMGGSNLISSIHRAKRDTYNGRSTFTKAWYQDLKKRVLYGTFKDLEKQKWDFYDNTKKAYKNISEAEEFSKKLTKKDILSILKNFKYDKSQYCLVYKAALVLQDVLPECNDVDIEISQSLHDRLIKDGYKQEVAPLGGPKFTITDRLEAFTAKDFSHDSTVVDGFNCKTVDHCLKEYKRRNRPKDQATIQAIERYLNEACKDLSNARKFVTDVQNTAKKYNANFFIVTDGASGYSNGNGVSNPAVKNARNKQIEWEKEHGFDPDEDWSKKKINEAVSFKEPFDTSDVRTYPLDKTMIDKYKSDVPGLRHVKLTPNNKAYIFIDNRSHQPIGYVVIEDKEGDKWIQALEVAPDFRKKGYGKNLLKFAQNQGAKFLSVRKNNDIAFNMYKNNGWKIHGGTDYMHFMIHEDTTISPEKSNVYYLSHISPDGVKYLYQAFGKILQGKIAVKLHSGEAGNKNFIKPEFWKPLIKLINGTVVECNTAYDGERNTSEKHHKVIKDHGWDQFDFDLMDEEGEDILPVENGHILKNNIVGSHLKDYDSMLVLSHFKGHAMGGYGGALKNISIGVASSNGKKQIHRVPMDSMVTADAKVDQNEFLMAMSDAAKSVVDHFSGNMVFINAMVNLSVDCDCASNAKEPCMKDIGLFISDDPVALDQACLDMIYNSDDPGKDEMIERIESRSGQKLPEYAEELGIGKRDYNLLALDRILYGVSEAEEQKEESPKYDVSSLPTADSLTPEDLSKKLKNMVRRIKMRGRHGLYKLNATQRDILSTLPSASSVQPNISTGGSSANEAFDTVPYDLNGCFLMENSIMLFDEANPEWNPHMKKVLYNERMRTSKEQLVLLRKVKTENPWIKYAYPTDFSRYQNRNVFYDLSYYIEIFFKNASIYKLKRGVNLFDEFMERLLDSKRIPSSYTKKTVFIPILDWRLNNATRMWMFREGINAISCIYDMMTTNYNRLKSIFGKMDVIFFSTDKYFKINFSELTPQEEKTLAPKFRNFIQKIVSNAPFDPIDEDDAPDVESTKVIVTNLADRLEKNRGINMSTQSELIGKLKNNAPKASGFLGITKETKEQKEAKAAAISKVAKQIVDDNNKALDKEQKEEKIKDVERVEAKKAEIIDTFAKAAANSKDTDSAIDYLDDEDLTDFKRQILDLEIEDGEYNISKTRAARMMELDRRFEDKEIKGTKIKDILDPEKREQEINAPLPTTKVPVDSPFQDQWSSMKFMNFDKTYDANKDIMKMLKALSEKQYPIAIRDIKIEDASTAEDYIDTYTIEMEDSRGKRFTQKLDIPKFKDGKYLLLRGNKKTIQNQYFNMPILKTEPDTVQVISNYSKIFIKRFGNTTGKTISYCDKLLRALNKYTGNRITFVRGDNSKLSDRFEAPMDYIDIGKVYNEIHFKTDKGEYVWYFNKDTFNEKYPKAKDAEQTGCFAFGINPDGDFMIYQSDYDVSLSNYIATTLSADAKFKELYDSVKSTKKYVYSKASIMSSKIPLVIICAMQEGLTSVLHKAGIKYELKEKLSNEDRRENTYDWIKFSDGYLLYVNTYKSSLLLNGLKEITPELYSINDIDKKRMWIDTLDNFGGRIKADGIENFYECMIDPITYEVLKHYKLPTDYVSLLIYGNNLLADNKYISHGDSSSRRMRKKELVAVKVYKSLFNDAYSTYANEMRRNINTATYSCKQSAVIDKFMADPTLSDFSVLNCLNDVDTLAAVSTKGESGMNAERAYTLDKRTYDSSMLNILGLSTGFSNNVGMTRQATINANIDTERGYIKSIDGDTSKMNVADTLTITEAVTPMGTTRDDPIRSAMTFIQTAKHQVRTEKSDPLIVTSGADEVMPYLATDIFCKKASSSGKVLELVEGKYMIVQYKDGTNDYVDLSERIEKCSDGGFYVNAQLITDLKVGSTFKDNQVLAYDKQSFSKGTIGESNKLSYNVGKLAKIAVVNSDDNFEDSAMVTTKLANDMATNIIMMESKVLSKDTNIYNMIKVGTKVNQEDIIYETQNAYDEEDVNILLKNLAGDKDQISKLGRRPVKSPTAGEICGIKLYRTCEINEMSESLQKLFTEYEKDARGQAKHLKELGIEDPTILPSIGKLKPVGKLKNCPNSVLIEVYIRYHDIMSVGETLQFISAYIVIYTFSRVNCR